MIAKTIIEPFRIKSVEPIRWTTRAQREERFRNGRRKRHDPLRAVFGMRNMRGPAVASGERERRQRHQ